MEFNSTEELIKDIKSGKMVILLDDEDRENEGDLVCAADSVTPEIINFMVSKGRGLVCLTLSPEKCDQLNLPMMTNYNRTNMGLLSQFQLKLQVGSQLEFLHQTELILLKLLQQKMQNHLI